MSEYVVMAESHRGAVLTLARGYECRDDAEDHPVRLKDYRRVWVEEVAGSQQIRGNPNTKLKTKRRELVAEPLFDLLVSAALRGERCPENFTFGLTSHNMGALARSGRIVIEVYALNWRVVTIMDGPHAGATTMQPPRGGKPWYRVDRFGRTVL